MSGEWASGQKKRETERVTGLGRRTREETVEWHQMGAGGGVGDIAHPRPPFGNLKITIKQTNKQKTTFKLRNGAGFTDGDIYQLQSNEAIYIH